MHRDLVPPVELKGHSDSEIHEFKTEYDVVQALRELGHEVLALGVDDELKPIRDAVTDWKPDIVFVLLEEFRGQAVYDEHVVGYLELIGVPYTGCNPRGMVLSRGKALSKKILSYHRIPTPRFAVFPPGPRVRPPRRLGYPCIVKSVIEDASLGISQASIVHDEGELVERVRFVHERIQTAAIVEQFISGRDVYVSVLGNDRLRVLPPQELVFTKQADDAMRIATAKVKHDVEYQKRWGIDLRPAELEPGALRRLSRNSKRIYRALYLDGYARIDYRVDDAGIAYFLEANANPDLARFEELASAAEQGGLPYGKLLQTILMLGLSRARALES